MPKTTTLPWQPPADIGDYLKAFACSAVMLQPAISLVLATHPGHLTQTLLGGLYVLVKFTAPAFIFGILYTTTRTHPKAHLVNYRDYLRSSWHALFVPTIWWTTIYLLLLPGQQQDHPYHSLGSFAWQFVNGQAAPHLWYNTMMLQFIILMPCFWALARYVEGRPRRGLIVAAITLVGHLLWLAAYWPLVHHGWVLLDRLFVSFLIYGIYGTLAAKFAPQIRATLRHYWRQILVAVVAAWSWSADQLWSHGFPVNLAHAPYYTPALTAYSLSVIAAVAALCCWHQAKRREGAQRRFNFLATYAYRAFLSNICWLQLAWWATSGGNFHASHPWLTLAICYPLTWLLSFGSALGIHAGWTAVKRRVFRPRVQS